jgi:bifunctional DNA-binding transcriptional regulator/antitoxin component of YhaV-PrlF toxin-antitoxin module
MLYESVRPGSEKARIWQICDELFAQRGVIPSGREVADIYVSEGGNEGTGFTQYSHWKKALAEEQEARAGNGADPLEPGSVDFRALNVSADGALVLPADIRRAMALDKDGRVTVHVRDGELMVISPMAAVRRLQKKARELVPGTSLVSDELIADRRLEAQQE